MESKIYNFSAGYSSATVQAHTSDAFNNLPPIDGLHVLTHLTLGNYKEIDFPVVFRQEYGRKWTDVLGTGWVSLYLVSDRLVQVLETHGLTGWKVFPVKLLAKDGTEVQGYQGLSVTGRSGRIDWCSGEIIEKRLVPDGPLVKYYRGVSVDLTQWDHHDFFVPEGSGALFITQKAYEIMAKHNFSNVSYMDIKEWEVMV